MNIEKLEKILKELNQPSFRLKQIKKAVYEDGVSTFSEISNLPKDLREALDRNIKILPFGEEKVLISKDKNSLKALLKLADGNLIETVLISPKPASPRFDKMSHRVEAGSWSACISSQVGCPLACAFCATGQMGFKRNLTAEEIAGQVLFWKQYLRKNSKFKILNLKLTNVVYMGMGEPFLNWLEVKRSLEILMDKNGLGLGSRSISISTVGVSGGTQKLAADFPQVNLAVSLHFANDEERKKLIPAAKKYSLENLHYDIERYLKKTNRKVFLEYVLLFGRNDSERDAQELADFIQSFSKNYLLHVNLISYNLGVDGFSSSPLPRAVKFKNRLLRKGVGVTIRKSLGSDIQGACGQLAGK